MKYREFHDAGYRFFGIKGVTDGQCDCENPKCQALYKHPWFKSWQHTPEWSDESLEVMEVAGQLDHGYGILVGNGLFVIDVDARNGGVESYKKLIADIPEVAGSGLIVETGSGGGSKHLYFTIPQGIALMQHHPDYPGIDFKATGYVIGPGSKHISGNRYKLLVGSPSEIGTAPAALIEKLEKKEVYRATFEGSHLDLKDQDIAEMLSFMDADCDHDTWIKSGMAVHHATGGNGFAIWDEWSSVGSKYPGSDAIERRWHSFGKSVNPVTIGTLIHYAKSAGWNSPVTFDAGDEFSNGDNGGINTDGIDLLRPPGFVGDVTRWVNTQGHKLRENLAVAVALVTVGNIAGLRYKDDIGMGMNLFAFCVAGSGTGKEAMLSAYTTMHYEAGVGGATHGAFKSEQELIRNLISHQAAFYAVDEIGLVLSMVNNASKKGGAPYLEALVATLMSVYSKPYEILGLTGDLKRDTVDHLRKEIARLNKQVEENTAKPHTQSFIESMERQLHDIERGGIRNPFLSLLGVTTPETFNAHVTPDTVRSGFISRALLFEERDTNPPPKPIGKKPPLPEEIKNTLIGLATGGQFDAMARRIECAGEPIEIKSTPEALAMLSDISMEFHALGDVYAAENGLEAITTRGFEVTAKVSAILAVASGVRTVEHVRWAYALAKNDVNRRAMLAYANDETVKDAGRQLMARILNRITPDHGETLSVLSNRIRGSSREDIERALKSLQESGQVEMKEVTRGTKTTERWFAK